MPLIISPEPNQTIIDVDGTDAVMAISIWTIALQHSKNERKAGQKN